MFNSLRPRFRPMNSAREDFIQKHKEVARLVKAGHSVRNAAKISGKGVSTVQRVKATMLVA